MDINSLVQVDHAPPLVSIPYFPRREDIRFLLQLRYPSLKRHRHTVRVFHVGNVTFTGSPHAFVHPVLPGHETITLPKFSFLVEHPKTRKRLMFDLGMRKDPLNFVPSIANGGIPLASIDTVIWSHSHSDHIGDMSKSPNTAGLVIAPDTDTSIFPDSPTASLQASDFPKHNVTKIDFAASRLQTHLLGLKPLIILVMGVSISLTHPVPHICPCARYTELVRFSRRRCITSDRFARVLSSRSTPPPSPKSHKRVFDTHSRTQQLFAVSDLPDSFYVDPITAQVSLEKLDADPDFFVVISHDSSLVSSLPYFPASLNGWKASRLKETLVWNFVDKTNPAFTFSPM
ncbi:hypothetical protein C8R44DRAFT_877996 [Mycena epipterygia]|nr:hypothetical protein C8R44DRAFT_877996 [Mycena epipterygia]